MKTPIKKAGAPTPAPKTLTPNSTYQPDPVLSTKLFDEMQAIKAYLKIPHLNKAEKVLAQKLLESTSRKILILRGV